MDDVENIRQRVESPSLTINRVPRPTFDAFKKLANDEFDGNYGFLLKALMDGVLTVKETDFLLRIESLETAFEELRGKISSQSELKPRRTLSGKGV